LQTHLEALQGTGTALLAVSPDPVEKLKETKSRLSLDFPLASDPELEGSRELGIVFSRGKKSSLPVPAVYVIGTDGVIQFSYVHPVYSVRLDMNVLLAAAKAASSEG
jgi:peroxiredoxin